MPRQRDELRQSKPFQTPEEEVFVALQRTADQLMRPMESLLKQYGLSPTQYNALRILRGAGETGLACNEIAERMITRDPDITRLMARLQRMGLIKRGRSRVDHRMVITRITARGIELATQLDRPVREMGRRLFRGLGPKKLKTLLGLLQEVRGPEAV